MSKHTPFGNDAASFEVAGLTVENGTGSIAVYGQADLTRDEDGLAKAKALLQFVQSVVQVLEADPALPVRVPPSKASGTVKNPFS